MTQAEAMIVAGGGERVEPSETSAPLRRRENPLAARHRAGEAVASLRGAARSLTQREPPAPAPRKRRKTGKGDGDRATPQAIVEDYLELCADPSKDLLGWLAAGERRRSGRQQQPITRKGNNYADTTKQELADANGIRGLALREVQIWMDAHRQGGRGADGVPARSQRTGFGRYDKLRPARGEATTALAAPRASGDTGAPDASLNGEHAALSAFYGAKIEATRRSLPAREVSAAIRAIFDEQSAAFRALADRRGTASKASRERRHGARFAAREATGRERAGVLPYARPS
jgi:hypothetical protein